MTIQINSTEDYHINEIESLGWELTVCNMLQDEESAARSILKKDQTFGKHLIDFLKKNIKIKKVKNVLEVGGGYGYIMKDIIDEYPSISATMLDISPFLIEKQKETLKGNKIKFLIQNIFKTKPDIIEKNDLVIFNENIGDFPTAINFIMSDIEDSNAPSAKEVLRFVDHYDLEVPEDSPINLNLGALQALELCCNQDVATIFMSEHSCEAVVPEEYKGMINIPTSSYAERIPLKGHDEYTIKFSHLETVGRKKGYSMIRGSFADLIPIEFTEKIRFILNSDSQKDEHEIIRHFIEDLFKYEFILFTRNKKKR